jgi:hypothetical protein
MFTPLAKGMQFDGHMSEFDEWLFGIAIFAPIGIIITFIGFIFCFVFCGREIDGQKRPGYAAAGLSLIVGPLVYALLYTIIDFLFLK